MRERRTASAASGSHAVSPLQHSAWTRTGSMNRRLLRCSRSRSAAAPDAGARPGRINPTRSNPGAARHWTDRAFASLRAAFCSIDPDFADPRVRCWSINPDFADARVAGSWIDRAFRRLTGSLRLRRLRRDGNITVHRDGPSTASRRPCRQSAAGASLPTCSLAGVLARDRSDELRPRRCEGRRARHPPLADLRRGRRASFALVTCCTPASTEVLLQCLRRPLVLGRCPQSWSINEHDHPNYYNATHTAGTSGWFDYIYFGGPERHTILGAPCF